MSNTKSTALIVGASRGLGLALAEEYLSRGWDVVATVRGKARTGLHDLKDKHGDKIEIETVDIVERYQVSALHERLHGRVFDLLFVNAGVANDPDETIGKVTTDEFVRIMVTNALSPMRVVEMFGDLVSPTGTIGVMSSGLGSVADNEQGGWEIYRGSKAALNTFMRSYAARHRKDRRSLVIIAPGWVRTDMGGPHAALEIDERHSARGGYDHDAVGEARPSLSRLPGTDGALVSDPARSGSQNQGDAFTVEPTTAATAFESCGRGSRSLGSSVVPGAFSIASSHSADRAKLGSPLKCSLGAKPSARLMA